MHNSAILSLHLYSYLKRFAAELKSPAEIALKLSAQSERAAVAASEAADEQIQLAPRIRELSAYTLRLKKIVYCFLTF